MRAEQLFDAIGSLDEEVLSRSERRIYRGSWWKVAGVAACFVFVFGIGMVVYKVTKPKPTPSGEPGIHTQLPDGYVEISELLPEEGTISGEAGVLETVVIGEYNTDYKEIDSAGSDILEASLGTEVEGNVGWYKVAGHTDMLYLIRKEEQEYTLWKFDGFRRLEYPYKELLTRIYGIQSAKDIAEIVSVAPDRDMTDEGVALQKEIGTLTITEREKIEKVYEILCNITCCGHDKWELIGMDAGDPNAVQNYVRRGRYLTIKTSTGLEITDLKYTGITKRFYENGGIAYNELDAAESTLIEEILQIK